MYWYYLVSDAIVVVDRCSGIKTDLFLPRSESAGSVNDHNCPLHSLLPSLLAHSVADGHDPSRGYPYSG